MRLKFILFGLLSAASLTMAAQGQGLPKFTTVKANPITSVKDQHRSGTCWCYATLGFIESEILRQSGKTYDLCEMFVVNHDYMDCATHHMRMHGLSDFTEGGSADDVFDVIRQHGICPEEAMPAPGSLCGDTLANFTQFHPELTKMVKAYASTKEPHPDPLWKTTVQSFIDQHVGECPKEFVYEGKTYTPQTFAQSLGIDWDNYVSLTSFTHHPFYQDFVIEAPYKWRLKPSYNIPVDQLMEALDHALLNGFCVDWGGDVSGEFYSEGIAMRSDSAEVTQEMRQQQFDDWTFTYDHVMLIYGIAHDEHGKKYYMVKNSWGDSGYRGTWYMSADYIKLNTTYIYLCKDALTENLKSRINNRM